MPSYPVAIENKSVNKQDVFEMPPYLQIEHYKLDYEWKEFINAILIIKSINIVRVDDEHLENLLDDDMKVKWGSRFIISVTLEVHIDKESFQHRAFPIDTPRYEIINDNLPEGDIVKYCLQQIADHFYSKYNPRLSYDL